MSNLVISIILKIIIKLWNNYLKKKKRLRWTLKPLLLYYIIHLYMYIYKWEVLFFCTPQKYLFFPPSPIETTLSCPIFHMFLRLRRVSTKANKTILQLPKAINTNPSIIYNIISYDVQPTYTYTIYIIKNNNYYPLK